MTATRDEWEYCRLSGLRADLPYFPRLVFFTVDGQKVEELGKDDWGVIDVVAKRIARLGIEGWEMVGMARTGETSHVVYFRRKRS